MHISDEGKKRTAEASMDGVVSGVKLLIGFLEKIKLQRLLLGVFTNTLETFVGKLGQAQQNVVGRGKEFGGLLGPRLDDLLQHLLEAELTAGGGAHSVGAGPVGAAENGFEIGGQEHV